MSNSVQSSILNISKTLEQIGQLEFRVRSSISSVALASNEEFEARHIRDADEAELSLFQSTSENNHRNVQRAAWSCGPALGRAHPIVDGFPDLKNLPKAHSNPGDASVTRTYLNAIKKLLEVYPQPRLTEHVLALSRQLETLQGSIADLQNTLNSMPNHPQASIGPANKGKKPLPGLKKQSNHKKTRMEMEDLIQREQLEILALTDMRDERRAELRELSEKILQSEIKPNAVLSPKKLKVKQTPSKTKSILFDANDPFVLSRAESLRRSIQRAKSPRIRNELPSSGVRSKIIDQGDDHNAPQTPTPKLISHKQIERNLSQLRYHNNMQLEDAKLDATLAEKGIADVAMQSLPSSAPENLPSPRSNVGGENVQLPESRLDTVNRLNKAFWKLGTMTELLIQLSPDLEMRQKGGGHISYESTISTLQMLVEIYPSPSLTPAQLMEAILYAQLLKSFSAHPGSDELTRLEVFTHEVEWCVPLESVKALLVKACEKFAVDVSLNRTVIYFLVGKGVIRIERRASPIAICVC